MAEPSILQSFFRQALTITPIVLSGLFTLYAAYLLSVGIYNVYFHPLSKFPGPKLAGATELVAVFYSIRGKRSQYSEELHAKYGPVVRTKPNELSFIGEDAWKDIYMHRQGHKQMAKAGRVVGKPISIIVAPDEAHARQRRLLSHAFSDRALREQEPLIQGYVDLLVRNLRDDAKENRVVNMVQTFNLITFDIVSDLSFGESFGGLETKTVHPWITAFYEYIMIQSIIVSLRQMNIPLFSKIAGSVVLPMARKRVGAMNYTKAKIEKRLDAGNERPDFMSYVLRHNDEKGMTREEIQATFNLLMIAGSETTATLLAGCTFLLQKNPNVRQKLEAEVRGSFSDESEITMLSVSHLKYLDAVIEESLRIYPPVPIALNRKTPPEGATICGHWVPGDVAVGVPQHAANLSPLNFAQPNSFLPERMLQNHSAEFDKDQRAVLQPFSAGPRNCIGKNLALLEIKLVLARIVYNFDLELVDKKFNWLDQYVFTLWRKHPLMVRVKDIKA